MAVRDQSFEERLRRIQDTRGPAPAAAGVAAPPAAATPGMPVSGRTMRVVLVAALGLGVFLAGLTAYVVREINTLTAAHDPLGWTAPADSPTTPD